MFCTFINISVLFAAVPALRVMKPAGGVGNIAPPHKTASSCCQMNHEAEAVC